MSEVWREAEREVGGDREVGRWGRQGDGEVGISREAGEGQDGG